MYDISFRHLPKLPGLFFREMGSGWAGREGKERAVLWFPCLFPPNNANTLETENQNEYGSNHIVRDCRATFVGMVVAELASFCSDILYVRLALQSSLDSLSAKPIIRARRSGLAQSPEDESSKLCELIDLQDLPALALDLPHVTFQKSDSLYSAFKANFTFGTKEAQPEVCVSVGVCRSS